jgi:hypothetical protein
VPELCLNDPPNKGRGRYPKGGAGNAGCPLHPQPRARSVVSTRVSHHGRTGTPGIPARDGFNGCFALSPVTGLVCHRRLADTSATLDASVGASGPHDFAVRKLARSSVAPSASIASQPYVRDDRETPLCAGRDGERYAGDLGPRSRKIRKIRNKPFVGLVTENHSVSLLPQTEQRVVENIERVARMSAARCGKPENQKTRMSRSLSSGSASRRPVGSSGLRLLFCLPECRY